VRKRYARSLFALPAAVLAAILGATTVLAAVTWTVRPGGPVTMKSGKLILTDTATGAALTCPSTVLSGTLKSGSGLPGGGIGSITTVRSLFCPTPLGPSYTLTARDLPWHLNVSSYNATTGVVAGRLSHLQIGFTGTGCAAVIDGTSGTASDGTVRVGYTNSTGRLRTRTTGGNLHFYHVSGCAGLLRTGDPATIRVIITISPRQTITSP
jgi:hypothetical protein